MKPTVNHEWDSILRLTEDGLYCPSGDFHIDPWRPVRRAVITHGHSDHARQGHERYLTTVLSTPIIKSRLGSDIQVQGLAYGERLKCDSATISFHPSGHILGSAQVRIEVKGRVAVVTGDFKREPDPTCQEFEVVPCDLLVTETTFGLPVYRWPDETLVAEQINHWWRSNAQNGVPSLLFGYALGKAQRLLAMLDDQNGPIYIHGALEQPTAIYREAGVTLPPTRLIREAPDGYRWKDAIILAVPGAGQTPWVRRFGKAATAMASGWMHVRGHRRRRSVDRGFVVSDHADWPGLNETVRQTGAREVWTTHGYTDVYARYLQEQGLSSLALKTPFQGEPDGSTESSLRAGQGDP